MSRVCSFLLILGFSARAGAYAICSLRKADFVASDKAGLSAMAIAAAPLIEILDREGNKLETCSSVVLSTGGTLMTAGHCLEKCLVGATQRTEDVTRVDRDLVNKNGCQVRVDGKVSSMKVLATNDCRGKEQLQAPSKDCGGLDYAVIQVDPGAVGDLPCFAVARRPLPPDTPVGSIGFPVESHREHLRRDAKDSDGHSQFFSDGKTVPFQDHCVTRTDGKPTQMSFPGAERNAALKRQVDAGTWIQTVGSEFLKKSSGGPLIDMQTFELAGIASFYILNTDMVECQGSTFYTSAPAVLSEIRSKYPNEDWDARTNCQAKAVGRSVPFRAVPL